MEVTEHALGVETLFSSLWALVFVPEKKVRLEEYLQRAGCREEQRAFCRKEKNGARHLRKTLCHFLVVCS